MIGRFIIVLAVLLGAALAPSASAQQQQQASCAAWAQRLQSRADAFDARCARTPMTINGPEWQACQAEHDAIMNERNQWIAACQR